MPTVAEVRTQLTGSGGMFEITTEVVEGVELQVYAERMASLRQVPELAMMRGDDEQYLVYGDDTYGFSRFVQTSNSVAHALPDHYGLGKGDRLAVLSQNNPEWCLSFWATVTNGAILVGLNGWWKTEEIIYGLQDSGAKILVADRKRFERIADQLDQIPDLEAIFLASDADPSDFAGQVGAEHVSKLHRFDELTSAPTTDFPEVEIAEEDPAVIFYTSGTTGKPKGAISTHRNMVANLQNTIFGAVAGSMLGAQLLGDDPDTSRG